MSHSIYNTGSDLELRTGLPGTASPTSPAAAVPQNLAIVSDPLLGQQAPAGATGTAPRTEIVFIEGNVGSLDVLRAGIGAGKEVYVLDAGQDGLQQIAQILAGRTGVDALHIISHGGDGAVNLGSLLLDKANLAQHQEVLQHIGKSLSADADILLYGCNVGAGNGQQLIEQFAVVTGADIAASNNPTGAAELGGDWNLEVQQGNIETQTAINPEIARLYHDVLSISSATVTFNAKGNFTSQGGNTYSIDDVNYKVNNDSSYALVINGTNTGISNT